MSYQYNNNNNSNNCFNRTITSSLFGHFNIMVYRENKKKRKTIFYKISLHFQFKHRLYNCFQNVIYIILFYIFS